MLRIRSTIALLILLAHLGFSQTLPLPLRATNATSSAEFIRRIETLPLAEREQAIASEILAGNVRSSLRELHPVALTQVADGKTNIATLFVTRDYLGVGSDAEFFRTPLAPATAQHIADELGCTLPTRKLVDAIHTAAGIKLDPQPIPPTPAMTTIPAFATHNEIIRTQLLAFGKARIAATLIAGHKKDVVISPKLAALTDNVAIYGWHRTNGIAIQPLYTKHRADWVDYSHGIRLVSQTMLLNGQKTDVASVLADAQLCSLLSDEGVIKQPRYPTNTFPSKLTTNNPLRWPHGFTPSGQFDELTRELFLANGVRVLINAPAADSFAPNKPVQLIFFALPNGSTVEQTAGKLLQPGDDWHFDIQHIGAQTRFLRSVLTNQTIVIAYLENSLRSWPAWRRTNGNAQIPAMLQTVREIFSGHTQVITLTGHSGGGSLTFGYLNAIDEIPGDIRRIAFLDSNYAYETTNHFAKLANWLKRTIDETIQTNRSITVLDHSDVASSISAKRFEPARNLNVTAPGDGLTPPDEIVSHHLCVLAYHDSIALLNGKTFVSERGGTWGRSHAMLEDFRRDFSFTSNTNSSGVQSYVSANGRIQLLLKENPERKILHTVQVERNGFIHSILLGTAQESIGYEYLGDRAYSDLIQK